MGGGGKGGSPSIPKSPSDVQQAKILKNIEETFAQPVRTLITPSVLQTLGGPGVFQTELPGVNRDVIEQQFKQAQQGILNTGPARGGQLNAQLADLQRNRAFDVSSAINQAKQTGIERALGMIPSALPNAASQMSARGQLASNDQQRLMQQAQMQNQAQASKGAGIGQLAGGALKAFK